VYFVPAGYVFAIWGIIYIGWIAFVIYQFLPAQKESPRLRNLGYLFALSGVFNAAWLFCWHYNLFGLSVLIMFTLLGLLIAGYLKLNVGKMPVTNAEKWSVDIPFSVYLGWISVATVANVTDWLYSVNWTGFGLSLGSRKNRPIQPWWLTVHGWLPCLFLAWRSMACFNAAAWRQLD
jgi:hypothetical protein